MKLETTRAIHDSVDAMQPIIYIKHFDFYDVDQNIAAIDPQANIYEYIPAVGEVDFKTKRRKETRVELDVFLDQIYESISNSNDEDQTNFIVLKGIHSQLSDQRIISWLTRISEQHLNSDKFNATIFIVSPILVIPPELESYMTVFDQPMPDFEEIYNILEKFIADVGDDGLVISESVKNELAIALKGLNSCQIKQVLNLAYLNDGEINASDCKLILKEKQRLIKKSGLLELISTDESINEIGGLETLKSWLVVKAKIYKNLERASAFGVDIPKGVLIVGMPGCGKSLAAKATASLFDLSLVRLDIGRLMGKYVGESEGNMRLALELAESISPCVLWIDEIEKAFSGVGSGRSGGSEVTTRLFGQFLTWMQEKTSPVFILATANDVTNLPPEFMRRGRFDDIFFVDLPNEEERKKILEVHLKKRLMRRVGSGANFCDINEDDLRQIASLATGFNGADLETAVKNTFEKAFVQNQQFISIRDLEFALGDISPIAVTFRDKIEATRAKLKGMNIMSAS